MPGVIDAETFWRLLEQLSNFFYNPEIFWGVPLGAALLWVLFHKGTRY